VCSFNIDSGTGAGAGVSFDNIGSGADFSASISALSSSFCTALFVSSVLASMIVMFGEEWLFM